MNKLFFLLLLMGTARAQQVSLEWDTNTETDLAGYYMYRSESESALIRITEVLTETQYTDMELSPVVVYTYAATAINESELESGFSNQVRWAYTFRGDANLSGTLTVSDAVAVMRHTSGLDVLTGLALLAADANGDGNVTISDAVAIMRHTAGLDTISGTVSVEVQND
jgi:hypothetical protein